MNYLKDSQKYIKGKMVFCGIDIHKHQWNLCFFCAGTVVERLVIPGNFKSLHRHVLRFYHSAQRIKFVYEAGFSGFHLYRSLRSAGFECVITPPNRVPSADGKIKTDKRDARKLARFLAGDLLKEIYVPSVSVEADRHLLRLRAGYQKKQTRVKNQIKSFLNLYGLMWPRENGNKWTKRYVSWLESLQLKEDMLRYTLDQHLREYRFIQDQIVDTTQRIKELSMSEAYRVHFARLTSCKGVGLITGMTFLLELGDIHRFSSAIKFCGYLGLSPSQHSSGERVRLGHITREGNIHLRRALVESSWTVIRYDPFLREKYERIRAKGTNGKKAIVAVARSLAIRLRRCLLDETPYAMGIC